MNQFHTIETDSRKATLPIHASRMTLWAHYVAARDAYWLPNEIDMSNDLHIFERLDATTRDMIKRILGFFAQFDELVNINIMDILLKEVPMLEAQYFYRLQLTIEDIHAETYALLLDTMILNQAEKEDLFNSIRNVQIINDMARFLCEGNNACIHEVLLRQAIVEGVFFMAPFCCIYWLRSHETPIPGLTVSNEFIARDENLHATFAARVSQFVRQEYKLTTMAAYKIADDAVILAKQFAHYVLPIRLSNFNADLLCDYIEQVMDIVLCNFGYDPRYNRVADLPFMSRLTRPTKEQMHEKRLTNYSRSGTTLVQLKIEYTDDF